MMGHFETEPNQFEGLPEAERLAIETAEALGMYFDAMEKLSALRDRIDIAFKAPEVDGLDDAELPESYQQLDALMRRFPDSILGQ